MSLLFPKEISPSELGEALYGAAADMSNRVMSDNQTLDSLELSKANRDYVFKEFLIIHFYCIIWSIETLIDNVEIRNSVLDKMHFNYYKELKTNIGFNDDDIRNEHTYILSHYKQYGDAKKEKRGPNELWPLSQAMLLNLHQERIKSIIAMTTLTGMFTNFMLLISDFVKEYKIVNK